MDRYTRTSCERELQKLADGDNELRSAVAVLNSLQETERRAVLEATARLANSLPKAGPTLAFEIVVKTARRLAKAEASR